MAKIWPPLTDDERYYWADHCKDCGDLIPTEFEDCSCAYWEENPLPRRHAWNEWLKQRLENWSRND